jgi:hypothetical protein
MVIDRRHLLPESMREDTTDATDAPSLIAELRTKLNSFPRTSADECWKTVQAIEFCLATDPTFDDRERVLLQRLKSVVSDIIAAHWEGIAVPPGLATLPLSALDGSIRRRRFDAPETLALPSQGWLADRR